VIASWSLKMTFGGNHAVRRKSNLLLVIQHLLRYRQAGMQEKARLNDYEEPQWVRRVRAVA